MRKIKKTKKTKKTKVIKKTKKTKKTKMNKQNKKQKAELKRKEKIVQLKYIKAKRLAAQMILISKELKNVVNDLDRYYNKY